MAFAYTLEQRPISVGSIRHCWGTFTNAGGDTGGDIVTGLHQVKFISLQHTGAAVSANAPAVNETIPLNSGTVTIVTDDDADGIWYAVGY